LRLYLRGVAPIVARLFGRSAETPELVRYYWDTIEACVAPPTVMQRLQVAGFIDLEHCLDPAGILSEYRARKPG
jgi:demethylmenaquinone methyltransferase/2-methoxy-6-polyprenyl-1,4-benzoquinol methylase